MRVYLSGPSRSSDRCAEQMLAIRNAGHSITFDWIANWGSNDAGNRCLDGVDACESFVLLIPDAEAPSIGAWVELGYAVAAGKKIVTIGDPELLDIWNHGNNYSTLDEWLGNIIYDGCHLGLKLLDADGICGACEVVAERHRNWRPR